jgi:hypothetical protein
MSTYTLYMHTISGDVATLSDWRADYESMDVESWHGKPAEEINPDNWIEDGKLQAIEIEVDDSLTSRTNALITGGFQDAKNGEQFWDQWQADGTHDGSNYRLIFEFRVTKGDQPEDDELPWDEDHIYSVERID